MSKFGRMSIVLLFFAILVLIQGFYWMRPINFEDIIAFKDHLLEVTHSYTRLSAMVYIGAFITIVIFGIPLSMTMIGGYLFGWWYGAIYSLLATVLGVMVLSLLVRYVIKDWMQARYATNINVLTKELERYGIIYLFVVYALPFMPNFFFHIAAGISNISLMKIFITNLAAALPTTCVYAFLGSYVHTLATPTQLVDYLLLIAVGFSLLALLALSFRWVASK